MAGGVMMSLRMDPELAAWAVAYAKERKVSRTALVEAAVRDLRERARAGVPDLGAPAVEAAPIPEGETEFQRDAREQAALAHATDGVGCCPQHAGGHQWGREEGAAKCIHCGLAARDFLDAATEQRTRLFSQMRAPKSVREGKAVK